MRKRIAFYGGSFDPVHRGHLAISRALVEQFELDEFVFVPAFHAPHKVRLKPTSAYDRYAMLCLATVNEPHISVSRIEIEMPEKPYSIETLTRLKTELPSDEIFFVMGADSWMDIKTWRDWERVLTLVNHIVVTRPGVKIDFDHVTDRIRERIIDLRINNYQRTTNGEKHIYITDAVNIDVSATEIRRKIRRDDASWTDEVPLEVANYIEKYQIYK
jgi:nicotinate-nucleotide adenylyltransferase